MFQSKEMMRTILQSIQFGMVIVGQDRKIRMVNKTALRMMGFESESELVGSVCHNNICPAETGKCPIMDLGQKVDLSEKILLDRDGNRIPILKTVSVIELDGEEVLLESFVDITERIKAEKKAEEARTFLQSVIDGVAEPVMVFGMDHRVTLLNRAAREFSLAPGKAPGDVMCYEVSHHRDTPCSPESGHPCPLEQVGATERTVTVVHEHFTPGGERRIVEIMAAPLRDCAGNTAAVVETSRDITERVNLERQRADFHAMVTHDLKSPLAAILGYADLLLTAKEDSLDEESAGMVSGIKKSGGKILSLVEDYLALSRMDSGKLGLAASRIDLSELIAGLIEDFDAIAREKKIDFNFGIEEGLPRVAADKKLMERAVSNLLQNAFNYTPSGGKVTLRAGRAADKEGFEVISVTDTGPGIPAEEQARVFEKYYRSPRAAGIKGSGLGLAIVKAVADAHGGRVELKSVEGMGSEFRLLLPL